MFILSALQGGIGLVRAALATIILVWVPIADAATCGIEQPVSSSSYEASAGQPGVLEPAAGVSSPMPNDSSSLPSDAQHCVHGHCHQPVAPQATHEEPVLVPEVAAIVPHVFVDVISYVTTGQERPPKA